MKKKVSRKAAAKFSIRKTAIMVGTHWSVFGGEMKRGQGRPPSKGKKPAISAIGEKLPFWSLDAVKKSLDKSETKLHRDHLGVYIAHDSFGSARYIGRGRVFPRLQSRKKAHQAELHYFSFYLIPVAAHRREIETLLIRAASDTVFLNDRKRRVGLEAGSVTDFEAGTIFFVRKKTARKTSRVKRGNAAGRS